MTVASEGVLATSVKVRIVSIGLVILEVLVILGVMMAFAISGVIIAATSWVVRVVVVIVALQVTAFVVVALQVVVASSAFGVVFVIVVVTVVTSSIGIRVSIDAVGPGTIHSAIGHGSASFLNVVGMGWF